MERSVQLGRPGAIGKCFTDPSVSLRGDKYSYNTLLCKFDMQLFCLLLRYCIVLQNYVRPSDAQFMQTVVTPFEVQSDKCIKAELVNANNVGCPLSSILFVVAMVSSITKRVENL